MKNLLKIFGIIALVAVIGFSMVACDNGTTSGGGGGLVLDSGWAWTDFFAYGAENSDGYIFRANGTVLSINNYDGPWKVDGTFTYTVSGNIITMDGQSASYTISGDSLLIVGGGFSLEFRKTNVGNVQ